MKRFLAIGILFLLTLHLSAQTDKAINLPADTNKATNNSNKKIYGGPRKATIMSAILPGLGQAYNKKYWKIPIVYAAMGGMVYVFKTNNDLYNYYRNNLLRLVKDTSISRIGGLDQTQLQTEKLRYKKYRDFAVIGIIGVYVLNIIDANVDAHLKTFDVSDDLSITWDPFIRGNLTGKNSLSGGISLTFHLKK